jgi:hypothetical protein
LAEHVGVNAPGTENRTILRPAKKSPVLTLSGLLPRIIIKFASGKDSPTLIAIS